MKDILDLIKDNFAAVLQAPLAFVVCVTVAGFIIYRIVGSLKAQEIGDLTSRLNLRVDEVSDYKRKLEGKTPDEAKAALDDLHNRLAKLEPVTISDPQATALAAAAKASPGEVIIVLDLNAARMKTMQTRLSGAFTAAGWRVSSPGALGLTPQPAAVVVRIPDPRVMTASQHAACDALKAAGLEFHLAGGPPEIQQPDFQSDIEIILSEK